MERNWEKTFSHSLFYVLATAHCIHYTVMLATVKNLTQSTKFQIVILKDNPFRAGPESSPSHLTSSMLDEAGPDLTKLV